MSGGREMGMGRPSKKRSIALNGQWARRCCLVVRVQTV